jgi:uncharacterized protein with FMN-binding domain
MSKHALGPARRIVLAMASTASVVALLLGYHTSTAGTLAAAGTTQPVISGSTSGTAPSGSTGSRTTSTTAGTAGTTGTASTAGSSTSTTSVEGDTVQTRYGPVQVRLAVSGSGITGVDVLQYPSGGHNQELSSYALPILVQETLDAQSAQVDMVSGATYTSAGYQQSLQSALDRAGL